MPTRPPGPIERLWRPVFLAGALIVVLCMLAGHAAWGMLRRGATRAPLRERRRGREEGPVSALAPVVPDAGFAGRPGEGRAPLRRRP